MEIIMEMIMLYRRGVVQRSDVDASIEAYYVALGERRVPLRRNIVETFDLERYSDIEVTQMMRFDRDHLPLLQQCFQIPGEIYIADRRIRVPGLTALCILLRRLAYPNRLADLEPMFKMSISALSTIFNFMVSHIMRSKGHLLTRLDNHSWLDNERLAYYAEAVMRKGAPLSNCWGFIDGTARHICRPSRNQEDYYSGHKRHHCLKFQSTVTPDGLIINLLGSFTGRRHDSGIFNATGFIDQLRSLCEGPDNTYVLYGDAAYSLSPLLFKPFATTNTQPYAIAFNRAMSKVRQAVEWGFGHVVRQFAFVDFHKNMKILNQDVSSTYKTAVILANCHTCLYGNQICTYFNTSPPPIEQYLQYGN